MASIVPVSVTMVTVPITSRMSLHNCQERPEMVSSDDLCEQPPCKGDNFLKQTILQNCYGDVRNFGV